MSHLEKLYRELFDKFTFMVCRDIQDIDTSKDVVQDVFYSIYKYTLTHEVKTIGHTRALLFKCLKLKIIDLYKRGRMYIKCVTHATEWYTDEEYSEEHITEFLQMIDKLPEKRRDILYLSLMGKSIQEVADIMNKNTFAITFQKTAAFKNIRKMREDPNFDPKIDLRSAHITITGEMINSLVKSGKNYVQISEEYNESVTNIAKRCQNYKKKLKTKSS